MDYVSWQVYTGRADGLRDDECADALGDPFHLPFTTAVQLRVAIGSSRLCRSGASHGTVADKSWDCTEPGDNTGFETCDGQSFGGADAAHPLPDFGTSRLLWPGPQPVEHRSDTAAGCWQRYADNVHGELALPLMAESEKLEGPWSGQRWLARPYSCRWQRKHPGPTRRSTAHKYVRWTVLDPVSLRHICGHLTFAPTTATAMATSLSLCHL